MIWNIKQIEIIFRGIIIILSNNNYDPCNNKTWNTFKYVYSTCWNSNIILICKYVYVCKYVILLFVCLNVVVKVGT